MMKAIGLIRVSTQAQQLESQSVKVKEAMIRDGYKEDEILLIEDKESGSKLSEEERSGLTKLKRIIDTEQIEAVYAYEVSRISRLSSVVISIRDYLIARKIQLIILSPPVKLLDDVGNISPEANMLFQLFSSMAENETYLRVRRVTRGKEKKKAEGKLSSGKPIFGYTVNKDP